MSQKRPAAGGESRKRDPFLLCALQRTSRGYERQIDDVIPMEPRKRGYKRRIDDVISTEQRKRGYERRIDDVIPTEQRKRGYERRLDVVLPVNAENTWIWQVETNVNLKKQNIENSIHI